jgi:preprotein translocase subunit SecA
MSSLDRAMSRARGFYPEGAAPDETGLDRMLVTAAGHLTRLHRERPARFRAIVPAVHAAAQGLSELTDEELRWQADGLRSQLRERGFPVELVGRAFALVREAAARRLDMRHFDVQLIGGWVLLNAMVAEMRTGEGKTLVATLPACAAALAGVPVHVITVNDYLAQRDAKWMGPVYEALGLTVGTITHDASPEERRRIYRCDVVYCTNKEIVFDYLRDRLEIGPRPGPIQLRLQRLSDSPSALDTLRLRGLCFAIVDEADSVLIDEARTPLIISGPGEHSYEAETYRQALGLAEQLEIGGDYRVEFAKREVDLTDGGKTHLAELAAPLGGIWSGRQRREDLVRKALTALHLFQLDKHYVVKDDKLQIVDEYTGRVMPGRSWEGGLHQLIESKEDCELTTETEVLGRISYQRFFRRYLALAGMTGTAREARNELWSVYRLQMVAIPTHKPMILRGLPLQIYRTADEKWSAVVRRIAELHALGRPVLVGTRTVASSEHLTRLLEEEGLDCRVLNAMQDAEEAEIIAQAGQRGQITVATNMAGRGTDIELSPEVVQLGGLHVLATERHDSGRIDRQLFGRGGRQGDPGTYEAFVSFEDELLESRGKRARGFAGAGWIGPGTRLGRWLGKRLFDAAARSAERKHFRIRRELLKLDESVADALAFSGKGE